MQKMPLINRFIIFLIAIMVLSCKPESTTLPILGHHDFITSYESGELKTDTVFYTIPKFQLENHLGSEFGSEQLAGKIHIADFFFTSCPTICPVMSRNMLALSEEFNGVDNLAFVSISIDPRHDSVKVLNSYYQKLGGSNKEWYFLTGEKNKIFDLAEAYMVSAAEDPHAPGGLIHSGAFILVDKQMRIRAYYDGTKDDDVEKLRTDLEWLIENE